MSQSDISISSHEAFNTHVQYTLSFIAIAVLHTFMHSTITFAVQGHVPVHAGRVVTNNRPKQNMFCLSTIYCYGSVQGLHKTADLGTGLRVLICTCTMLVQCL